MDIRNNEIMFSNIHKQHELFYECRHGSKVIFDNVLFYKGFIAIVDMKYKCCEDTKRAKLVVGIRNLESNIFCPLNVIILLKEKETKFISIKVKNKNKYIFKNDDKCIIEMQCIYGGILFESVGLQVWFEKKRVYNKTADCAKEICIVNKKFLQSYKNNIPDFLVARTDGLFLYTKSSVSHLIRADVFYGLTKIANEWWGFLHNNHVGKIISFFIDDGVVGKVNVRIDGLHQDVHQIDFVGDALYVSDTANNRILVYSDIIDRFNVSSEDFSFALYPNGEAKRGDKNYCHFNSIFEYNNKIYVVAHNYTMTTGKSSEIYKLDKSGKVEDIIKTKTNSAHNCYIDEANNYYICDSASGGVKKNSKDIFKCNYFTRGLSLSKDFIIVGGSSIDFVKGKAHRSNLPGKIFVLNNKFQQMFSYDVFKAQIMEIRQINDEFGLTNYRRG